MLVGYVRVSKSDGSQTLAPQRDAMTAAGLDPGALDLRVPLAGGGGVPLGRAHAGDLWAWGGTSLTCEKRGRAAEWLEF